MYIYHKKNGTYYLKAKNVPNNQNDIEEAVIEVLRQIGSKSNYVEYEWDGIYTLYSYDDTDNRIIASENILDLAGNVHKR